MRNLFYLLLVCIIGTCFSSSWDSVDFEIYDLYEEVNGTFYDLLNVSQDVSTSEIRRAYRKLSLQLHPDRNKAEDAEVKFRQLVSVYEVLKDTSKREKYEEVLKNGLPTWRQPMYYYRKYRKMGGLEVSILVAVIATIGHYLTWWVVYLEKKFEMDELLRPVRKRREKKRAKGKVSEEDELTTDEVLVKELGYRRPTFWDFLPFVLYRLLFQFIKSVPTQIMDTINAYKAEKERKRREEEELKEAAEAAKIVRPKKVKPKISVPEASEFDENNLPEWGNDDVDDQIENQRTINKKKEWGEEDYAALAKAMAKFPGGTPGRWDRIAHDLGRSVDEVTRKVKNMKESLASNISNRSGNDAVITKKKLAANISDGVITKAIDHELNKTTIITDSDLYQSQYDIPDDYDEGVSCTEEQEIDYTAVVKKKVKTRPTEEIVPVEENENEDDESTEKENKEVIQDVWSQVQQKCLEAALAQFPKSTSDRWTCIARAVPDKTKEQCIVRFKQLAEHVKQRKNKQGKGS